MGFPTMKEAIVTEKLTDSNKDAFFDKVKQACGNTLMHLNDCRKLAAQALVDAKSEDRKVKIVEPYAKVGVVDGQLVFRIKHKGGHYGEKDIVLAENYEDANSEAKLKESKKDVLGLLDPAGAKPELTAQWWRTARGQLAESQGLEKILVEYEQCDATLRGRQSLANHLAMFQCLNKLTACANNVYKQFQPYKNDKAIMDIFVAKVRDANNYWQDKSKRYRDEVEQQVKFNQDSAESAFKLEQIDGALKQIVGDLKNPSRASLSDADGALLSVEANLANARKAVAGFQRGKSLKGYVDDNDVLSREGNSLKEIMTKAAQELAAREKIYHQLKDQVEEGLNRVLSEPSNEPPEYQELLAKVIKVYDKVTEDIKGVQPEAVTAASNALKVKAPTDTGGIPAVLGAVDTELKACKAVRDKSANIFSSTRAQGEGSELAKGLKPEDLIHTRKRTTQAKAANKNVNAVVDKGCAHLESVLKAMQQLPGADRQAGRINDLLQNAQKQQEQMNAF
jgi:hypothetical protein